MLPQVSFNSTYQKAEFRVPKTVLWLIIRQLADFKPSFVIKVPPFG
jgi:hypothetical protein